MHDSVDHQYHRLQKRSKGLARSVMVLQSAGNALGALKKKKKKKRVLLHVFRVYHKIVIEGIIGQIQPEFSTPISATCTMAMCL